MSTSTAEMDAQTAVHQKARRRVPLQFDENGDPYFGSVTSPESFKMRALCVMPPRHVIPVIFVPGIMGSNLCSNGKNQKEGASAWTPPNGIWQGLGEVRRRSSQTPANRQQQMSPDAVKVDNTGPVHVPRTLFTLTEKEAKRRGWGEVHLDSYGKVLAELEMGLNEQYSDAGTSDHSLLPVWQIAKTLKYRNEDVRKHWNPVNPDLQPLSDDEFTRLDYYYYPVWACGYNWLGSNEASSDQLVARIQEALDWYAKGKYWIPVGKVIIVTHSMGGLVARRAVQKAQDRILGVVHGVQPVGGAPVVYRRMRAGVETNGWFDLAGMAAAAVFGWSAADITCVMANSPGPLELLPTKHYPPGWLRFEQNRGGKTKELMPALPLADPYTEIYAKRVQDVWWGMIDETLIDPAHLTSGNDRAPFMQYKRVLKTAMDFHEAVKLDCHPVTYAHYGSDPKQVSFGKVVWTTTDDVGSDALTGLAMSKAQSFTLFGKSTLLFGDQKLTLKLEGHESPTEQDNTNAGDGTVPLSSGALISKATPEPKAFSMTGFDHAASYKDENVLNNVLYCLAKIAQLAPAVSTLPSTKG
ncbi:hypothetical protein [Paraburkholderia kururiensis]|uniref:PGAP1-like protein n=1 Tax=Paraburkholderia kururiensis TaxID=984307 RepID=A0ABZ0WDT4_9BURK|nr:hypothetical protein [Paraburkholderia kururiensis]WQD75507.1 hypothetical protein U0042_15165 [Paraburkholderia kururiensis]